MGNKCPCIASGARTKSNNDEYVVSEDERNNKKQDKNKKKNASKYSVPPDGLENSGFTDNLGTGGSGGGDGEFTNIANVTSPNGGPGPQIQMSPNQEEIQIVYNSDERPIDVPGVKYVNNDKSPKKNKDSNHNTSKLSNAETKVDKHESDKDTTGSVFTGADEDEIIDTRLRLPSADVDLDNIAAVNAKAAHDNPAFEDSDTESLDSANIYDKITGAGTLSSQGEKREQFEQSRSKNKYDKDSLSSHSKQSDNEDSKSDISDDHNGADKRDNNDDNVSVNADDIDFQMEMDDKDQQGLQLQKQHKTFETTFDLTQDSKPQIDNTQANTFETTLQAVNTVSEDDSNQISIIMDNSQKRNTHETKIILQDADNLNLQENESSDFVEKEQQKRLSVSSTSSSGASSTSGEPKQALDEQKQTVTLKEINTVDTEENNNPVINVDDKEKSVLNNIINDMVITQTNDEQVFNVHLIQNDKYSEDIKSEQQEFTNNTNKELDIGRTESDSDDDNAVKSRKLEKDKYNSLLKEIDPREEDQAGLKSTNEPSTVSKPHSMYKDDTDDSDDEGVDSDDANAAEAGAIHVNIDDAKVMSSKPWLLKEDAHNKKPQQSTEANREVEEIMLLIDKLEDSLVTDMTSRQDAETLSRNIVEKLDEISALREQAEMEMPIEVVMQEMADYEDNEEEDEEFQDEQAVIDWYSRRMDELNEAVGMDLLEMSIAESLTEPTIRPLFEQHKDTQSYFIKKRIVELEKLRRKKLVTNQRDLYEPHPESPVELHKPMRSKDGKHDDEVRERENVELSIDDLKDFDIRGFNSGQSENQKHNADMDIKPKLTGDTQSVRLSPPVPEEPVNLSGLELKFHTGATYDNQEEQDQITSVDKSSHLELETDEIGIHRMDNVPKVLTNHEMLTQEIEQSSRNNLYQETDVNIGVNQFASPPILSTEQRTSSSDNRYSDDYIFQEQDESVGVNQFVSPSKSEEDLWSRVESLHSKELDEDEVREMDILESQGLASLQMEEINSNVYTMEQRNVVIDNEQTIPEKETNEADIVLDFEASKPVTKAKVMTMYDSDSDTSDDSSRLSSVTEEDVIANSEKETDTLTNSEFLSHVQQSLIWDDHSQNSDSNEQLPVNPAIPMVITTPPTPDDSFGSSNKMSENDDSSSSAKPVPESSVQEPVLPQHRGMYGPDDTSDESETEELVRKAFEMEQETSSKQQHLSEAESENDISVEEAVVMAQISEKPKMDIFMQNKQASRILEDQKSESFDSVEYNEQFNADPSRADALNRSQSEANDILAEIQALNEEDTQQKVIYSFQQTVGESDDSDSEVLEPTIEKSQRDNNRTEYMPDLGVSPISSSMDRAAVYQEPQDNALMSLALQPIPPLSVEDNNSIDSDSVNVQAQICSKETGEPYPQKTNVSNNQTQGGRVLEDDDDINTHPKLERKSTKEIMLPDANSNSDTDTDGLIEAAYEAEKSSDDDSDTEEIINKYEEIQKLKPAKPVLDESSESEASTLEEDSDDDQITDVKIELRETLKGDIRDSLHHMTQDDFKNLMGMYRQERGDLRNMREQEKRRANGSLWEKLQRRKEAVDQYVHEGVAAPEIKSSKTSNTSNGASIGVQVQPSSHSMGVGDESSDAASVESEHEEDDEVEESMAKAEELTQTVQLMDLEIVQHAAECENKDEIDQLLSEHFDMIERMRKDNEDSLIRHRERVKQRLEERKKHRYDDSSSDDSCNEENTENKDTFIESEMSQLKDTYLSAIKTRKDVTEQQLHDIIVQYRDDQQDLIRKREYEKLRINEKLRLRLEKTKAENEEKKKAEAIAVDPFLSLQNSAESSQSNINIAAMDEEFYQDLYRKQKSGELSEEEMGALIEEHLDRVEEFKRKVQSEMKQRRKARTKMSQSLKHREAELMIHAEKEEAEIIRQLREKEKKGVDAKLKDKLQKKKIMYQDTPDLPPPKRPAKSKSELRREQKTLDYENMEYDC